MPLDASPIAALRDGLLVGGRPMPLLGTDIHVRLAGPVAGVRTVRRFRNGEDRPIEATLTFPVPPAAAVHALEVRVGGRLLRGVAKAREKARASYEEGMERGKASFLHEQVAAGVHMLSLGQLAPGAECEVTVTWAAPLSVRGPAGRLVVPTTIGDIYGEPPMQESDAPIHGAFLHRARVFLPEGAVLAGAVPVADGPAEVSLDRPLVIDVPRPDWGRPLPARVDGRDARLVVSVAPDGESPLRAALLIDRSGSMAGDAHARTPGVSRHASALSGLRLAAESLGPDDEVEVWQFDDHAERVGGARGPASFLSLLDRLAPPRGGTQTDLALRRLHSAGLRNVLLVTDGNTWRSASLPGMRLSAVVVGEDAMTGPAAELCARSGGELFEAPDRCDDTLVAAFGALRRGLLPAPVMDGARPVRLHDRRAGAALLAEWGPLGAGEEPDEAASALCAAMAFNVLPPDAAAALSERAGLVTGATSLVLVDEEGATVEGLADVRKVPLSTPSVLRGAVGVAASGFRDASAPLAYAAAAGGRGMSLRASGAPVLASGARAGWDAGEVGEQALPRLSVQVDVDFGGGGLPPMRRPTPPWTSMPEPAFPMGLPSLRDVAAAMDWSAAGTALERLVFPPAVEAMVRSLALTPEFVELARRLGKDARLLVLARAAMLLPKNRAAARFARAVLGKAAA